MPRLLAAAALLMCLAAPLNAHAQENPMPQPMQNLLSVAGHGEMHQRPDMVTITAGVSTQAETASAALQQNSAAMQGVMQAAKEAGVADKDMQTSNFSVQPRYDYSDNAKPQFLGYEVQNSVTLSLRDVGKLGAALDQLVKAGANQITGISFDVANPASMLDEARRLAVADARHKAEVLAQAGGVKLGKMVSLVEGGAAAPPVQLRATAAKAAFDGAAPVAAGENVITADVNISWSLD